MVAACCMGALLRAMEGAWGETGAGGGRGERGARITRKNGAEGAGGAQGNGEWEDRAGTGHELGRWGKRAGGQKGMDTRGETEYAETKGGKGEEDTWGRVNGINGIGISE